MFLLEIFSLTFHRADYFPSDCFEMCGFFLFVFFNVQKHASESTGRIICSDLGPKRPTCSGAMPRSSSVHNLLPLPGGFLDGRRQFFKRKMRKQRVAREAHASKRSGGVLS